MTGAAPDVAVIGAGIVGVSVAEHLAAAGASVRVFEAHGVAAAASGRNSGVVQHPFDPVLAELHLGTLERYRRLAEEEPKLFGLPAEPAGLLLVSRDPAKLRAMAGEYAKTHRQLRPEFLAQGEVTRLEPAVAEDVAACRLAIGYPVAPASATHAIAARARELGVRFQIGRPARLRINGGRVAGVRAGDRFEAAGAVVVAAGPWSPGADRSDGGVAPDPAAVGRGRRGRPCRPAGPCPRGGRHRRRRRGPDPARRERTRPRVQPRDGQRRQLAGFDLPALRAGSGCHRPSASSGTARRTSRPSAKAVVGASRSCARPLSVDGRPLIGRVPGTEGLWIAAGHGPWGVSTGPDSGRLLADLLLGQLAEPPAALDPARFGAPPRAPPSRSAGRAGRPCPGARFRGRRPRRSSGSRGRAGR